jgi:acyl-CoA synthetase (AMP-forming)/AMP-acid ligase II
MLPNIPETALITLAAASIGVVTVLMNPAYQLVEVEYMVKQSKCKGIFILDNLPVLKHYELLKKICPELEESTKGELNASKLPDLKHVFVCSVMPTKELESKHKGTWSFNEVKKHKGSNKEMPYVDYDDDFVMMFTSGSTGFPKAAPIRHSAIINTARSIHFYSGCSVNTSFKNICIPIPVFHIVSVTVCFYEQNI